MTTKKRRTLSDTTGVTMLGSGSRAPGEGASHATAPDPETVSPVACLEAFPFRHPGRDTVVTFHCTEFSCVCPVTGQPDYATLEIRYVPAARALESKSLKTYLWTWRDVGGFHEDVVNRILDELFDFLEPKWMRVLGRFNVRGGISIDVEAERGRQGRPSEV